MSTKKPKKRPPSSVLIAQAKKSRGVDLRQGRFYRYVRDDKAREKGLVRIVDASGEDYLYPATLFQLRRVAASKAKMYLFGH